MLITNPFAMAAHSQFYDSDLFSWISFFNSFPRRAQRCYVPSIIACLKMLSLILEGQSGWL